MNKTEISSKVVFYLCDKKKCERCSKDCKHTTDIKHAKNFKKLRDGVYYEEEKKNR